MFKKTILLLAIASSACAEVETSQNAEVLELHQSQKTTSFDVVFNGCTEFAGIGLVPEANARPLVPLEYTLVSDTGNAFIVVRTVECTDISVDGSNAKPGKLSQIGIMLAGGDLSADINNYTLWYVTDHAKLHAKLRAAGLDSIKEPGLQYSFVPAASGGSLAIASSTPQAPSFTAVGGVSVPVGVSTTFVATWWADGRHGTVQTRTAFPDIVFTFDGNLTLDTPSNSDLAQLIGGTTLNFPVLNSHNQFDSALMTVALNE